MTTRRNFHPTAGVAAGAATLAAPAVHAQSKIKWRMQTYAGATLAEHVTKPFDSLQQGPNEMEIELFFADQIVPTGELFRAMQKAPSMRCSRMTIRWQSPVEVGRVRRLLPVRLALSSMCRCCSTSTA
jgi:TRAP-type mannitol/chloroaromatic compound transport system substrate-binding protein